MSDFRVYITPVAWNEIRSLPGHIRQRVRRAIIALATEPHPPASRALDLPEATVEGRRLRLDR